jgi:hypothetical protein
MRFILHLTKPEESKEFKEFEEFKERSLEKAWVNWRMGEWADATKWLDSTTQGFSPG